MDIYESLFSSPFELNEQIARQIFESLPEQSPVIVIIDRTGNIWPSDSEKFVGLNISDSFLKDICSRIDDGVEPAICEVNDCSITAAQLATDRSNCGYVLVALPKCNPESAPADMNLIELLLNQFCLVAKLLEKNNLLYEHQMKPYTQNSHSTVALN